MGLSLPVSDIIKFGRFALKRGAALPMRSNTLLPTAIHMM